jgi:riboflavin kinase/FMN adenylyltransferase
METIYFPGTENSIKPHQAVAATIGFFDGLHLGHRHLISMLRKIAEERQMASAVVTFECHPRQVLGSDWQPQLLTTLEEKKSLIEAAGVDKLIILRFNREMAALSAHNFMEQVLLRQLGVQVLLTGYDNRFGHNRSEGFDDYVSYGKEMGIDVVPGTPLTLPEGGKISSSVVRRLLQEGNVTKAAQCLGHSYELSGTVVSGQHIGTELGFPTANLSPEEPLKLIPKAGAYAVEVLIPTSSTLHPAMMNIGTRPTFDGQNQTLEVHLLDYIGNLYGEQLTVRFRQWLRPEQRYDSREQLMSQLQHDAERTKELLSTQQ